MVQPGITGMRAAYPQVRAAWNAERRARRTGNIRGAWRMRAGLGQDDGSTPGGGNVFDTGDIPTTGPAGSPNPPVPPGSVVTAGGITMPGQTIPGTNEVVGATPGPIGSSVGCAPGYVVGGGGCVPPSNLAASLASSTGAASLGLTAAQAAAIRAGLQTAQTLVGGVPTTSYIAPVTNPFADISPMVWVVGAAGLVAVLLLSKKR